LNKITLQAKHCTAVLKERECDSDVKVTIVSLSIKSTNITKLYDF